MKQKRRRDFIIGAFVLTLGAILAGFSVEEFLVPNKIFDGGVVGISMIVGHYVPLPLGTITIVLNLPFLIYAWKRFGHTFIIKAAYAMVIFAVSLHVFEPMVNATYDSLLATVFGGVFLGAGVGLVLRGGGCLDGTEIVGIAISRNSQISVGRVVLIINVFIYSAAGIMFGLESGMYSILMYFVSSKVIDIVEVGWDQAKAVMIITEEGQRVADEIYKNFGRTVTFLKGSGLVSKTEKNVLYCVVTRAEIYDIRKMISDMDIEAFTTITDVSDIIGNHVKRVPEKKKTRVDK